MSIPIKGSRKIIVDGEKYLWTIRRKTTTEQQICEHSCYLNVAVQDIEQCGCTLIIKTHRLHPYGFEMSRKYPPDIVPITPSDVCLWIRQAINLGWQPKKLGKTFIL